MTDDVLAALWERALDRWDDEAVHAAFVEHCRREGRLGDAAARYASLRSDEARRARAMKRLDAVIAMAAGELGRGRTSPPRRAPAWLVAVAALVFAAMVAYLWARIRAM